MPFVPDLESSSQIVDDTLTSEQQSRLEIDVTPAEAVKTRRNRRKKRTSSNAFMVSCMYVMEKCLKSVPHTTL